MLERENKRERILESKVKEMKIKLKAMEREAQMASRNVGQTNKISTSQGEIRPNCLSSCCS